MAKGIYVGIGTNTIKGNIIPTVWQELSQGISYSSSNGFYLKGNTYNSAYTRYASNACDGNTSTYFESGSITCGLTIQCPKSIKITKMKVAIAVGASNNIYTISGSNNGSTYTEIYSGTGTGNTLTEITITNPGYYTYYKIDAPGRSGVYSSIYEIQTSEYEENLGKVTKAYVGVDGKARKIKKGYIGVDGVARLFYKGTEPQTITNFATPSFSSSTYIDEFGGEWKIDPPNSYTAWNNNADDYYTGSVSSITRLTLTLPEGYYLTPKKFWYTIRYCSWNLYGVAVDGTEYQIASGGNGSTGTVDSYFDIKTANQREYVKFYLDIWSYNGSTAPQMKEAYFYDSILRIE